MGSLGDDDDGEIKAGREDPNANFAPSYTQPFDSQFLPSPLPGNSSIFCNIHHKVLFFSL